MLVLFLANGFEEAEALIPLDMLRRAGIPVTTVGVGDKIITGAHHIPVVADITCEELDLAAVEGVILPGGMPGTKNLETDAVVSQTVDLCAANNRLVAAICAAPSILGHKGLLGGKQATCFPGFEEDCLGAQIQPLPVVTQGNIITARGAGCAFAFGAAILTYLKDAQTAQQLLQDMQWNYERHS